MKLNKYLFSAVAFSLLTSSVFAQNEYFVPCPTVNIEEHNHTSIYAGIGCDTAVSFGAPSIVLNADVFMTTQNFNGTYLVESIPYNPPDTTFMQGTRLSNISADDVWDNQRITFDFPFAFFGVPKSEALVGANGLITFAPATVHANSSHCAYSYSVPIPSASFPSKEAIYGVYEDIDPGATQRTYGSHTSGAHEGWGIYKYVGGEFPCRYISTSVRDIVLFGNNQESCTYCIVCYEGTNIIEVHVKRRSCCASTNAGKGLIGIQNAAGTVAFVAPDRGNQAGGWTGETEYEAWRFTPQGTTTYNISWYRKSTERTATNQIILFNTDNTIRDTLYGQEIAYVADPTLRADSNYVVTNDYMQLAVQPTVKTTYYCRMRYYGATGYLYDIVDSITVCVDLDAAMSLNGHYYTAADADAVVGGEETGVGESGYGSRSNDYLGSQYDNNTCVGQESTVELQIPNNFYYDSINWRLFLIQNGVKSELPRNRYRLGNNGRSLTVLPNDNTLPNHIDTTLVEVSVNFTNGRVLTDKVFVLASPNFDYVRTATICEGETYLFGGHDYTATGYYTAEYTSSVGCDSVEHLSLLVLETSYNFDRVEACEPYTWIHNGVTYYTSNNATALNDTIRLKNQFGCDSIVQLELKITPVVASINATPTGVRLDNLTVTLVDMSTGSDSRTWHLFGGETSNEHTVRYNFPVSEDSVILVLTAHNSVLGCDDQDSVTITMLRETVYLPNAFTPDEPINNTFKIFGEGVNSMEMIIFNRWGEQVFHSNELYAEWDGTHEGVPCSQGAYVYIIKYTSLTHPSTQVLRGTVTLIR